MMEDGSVQRFLLLGLSALLALSAFAAGCGGGDGDQTIDVGDGQVSTSDELPDNFPDELPRYAGAKVLGSVTSEVEGSSGTLVTFETDDSADDVGDFYASALEDQGWNIETESSAGGARIFLATSGDTAASISVSGSDDEKTVILVTYGDRTDLGLDDGSDDGDDSGDEPTPDGGDDSGDEPTPDGGDDSGSSGDADLPDEVEVDEDFPDDIALPSDAYVTDSSSISAGGMQTLYVGLLSEQSVDDLEAHFASELTGAGYTETLSSSSGGDAFLTYSKGDDPSTGETVIINIQQDSGYEGYALVAISVTQPDN
jgi:hypothetical protein